MAFRTPEARRTYQKAWLRAKRVELKIAGRCCDCRAVLQEDDGARCVECDKRDKDGKAARRDDRVRKRENAASKSRRQTLQAEGKCVACARPRGDDGSKHRCAGCQKIAREHAEAYRKRKREGVVVLATARRRRELEVDPDTAPELTRREASAIGAPRARILRAMRFLEWATTGELWAALEIGDYDDTDLELRRRRDRYAQALAREVRAGTVARREVDVGKYVERTYHLTDEGRRVAAELAKRTA